jgi:UDP-N-acetyl-D-mannosaminuronic acid dehydrogenase
MQIIPSKIKMIIIGGAGHIGLPIGILFASKGVKITLYDKNKNDVKKIYNCQLLFIEEAGEKIFKNQKYNST